MSSRFDLIAEQLLQKSFADCTVTELQQLVEGHPYMAPAQFLLAKKMLHEGMPSARAQVQKAALYYHQPALFDAFLHADFSELDTFHTEDVDQLEEDAVVLPEIHIRIPGREVETAPAAIETAPPVNETVVEAEQLPLPNPELETRVTKEIVVDKRAFSETEPAMPIDAPEPEVHERATNELPAFEPYHTVDYFASQGIRLSQEEAAKDKMGRQLKSFTEWLKTMKRLPATEQIKDLDPYAEKKVEHLAAHSVEEAEIVTEAMAEVWLKQGNLEKAAAVYHKLSLSNPSKRAYFAAKLESLKKNV